MPELIEGIKYNRISPDTFDLREAAAQSPPQGSGWAVKRKGWYLWKTKRLRCINMKTNLKSRSFPMSLTYAKPTFKHWRPKNHSPPPPSPAPPSPPPAPPPTPSPYTNTTTNTITIHQHNHSQKPESPEKSRNVGEKNLRHIFMHLKIFWNWGRFHLVCHVFWNETLFDHEEDVVDTHHIGLACVFLSWPISHSGISTIILANTLSSLTFLKATVRWAKGSSHLKK